MKNKKNDYFWDYKLAILNTKESQKKDIKKIALKLWQRGYLDLAGFSKICEVNK